VILRRRRFHDLVERQLDLFESETELLTEAAVTDAAWTTAAADDSEELYGDHQLVVDAIGDALQDIREAYAATLDESTADDYRAEFDAAARKRFGRYASALAEGREWR
jgi:hypothetical protein